MRLEIRQYGDPVLRAKGKTIAKVDEHIRALARDMLETMHLANGVGLAAQQIGEALQLTVIDIAAAEDRPSTLKVDGRDVDVKKVMPIVLVNPQVTLGSEKVIGTEGCLSFPDITSEIERSETVRVEAEDLEGRKLNLEATGLLARAIQHEVDHLNGILFIDRMTSAAKTSLASRLKRMQKETERGSGKRRLVGADQRAL